MFKKRKVSILFSLTAIALSITNAFAAIFDTLK